LPTPGLPAPAPLPDTSPVFGSKLARLPRSEPAGVALVSSFIFLLRPGSNANPAKPFLGTIPARAYCCQAMQADLFDAAILPGLAYAPRFLTAPEERALIARIDAADLAPFRFHGWLGKRLTASFGWRYDFDDASFRPTEPIPGFLMRLSERAAAFAGLPGDALVQVLLTRYDPGAGIGWHRDRPVFEHVVGISLAAAATLRFRRRTSGGFERVSLPLAPGSAYHLSGEARWEWEHSIAPMDALRRSITFRSLSDKGLRAAGARLPAGACGR